MMMLTSGYLVIGTNDKSDRGLLCRVEDSHQVLTEFLQRFESFGRRLYDL
jgi:hypothetical protein